MIRPSGLKRWLWIWLALLGASALLVQYADHGPPESWPDFARMTVGSFLAPGAIVWMAMFWHAFGGGPAVGGLVSIVVVNSIFWTLIVCLAARVLGRLRR